MRALLLVAALLLAPSLAAAKSFGIHQPSGRTIYGDDERFGDVLDQDRRQFVVEVAVGAGPEGNLGMAVGWLMPFVRGLELYLGAGVESNPAVHYTLTMRYLMNLAGYRPYVGAGYLVNALTDTGTLSQNVFAEVGYSWKVAHTFHFTLGIGLRRLLHVTVLEDSPLNSSAVDPAFLEEQIDAIPKWLPTIALRFSRAF